MIDKYFIYYAGGIAFIYFVFKKVIPFFRKAKTIAKGLFSKIYLNKNSDCTQDQYKKISLGAIYSEQQTAYINSLTTGLGKSNIKNKLSQWWAISSKDEAIRSLDYLSQKGFRFYFDKVYEAFLSNSADEQRTIILNGFDEFDADYNEDLEKAFDQLQNLTDTWVELTRNNIIENEIELKKMSNIGWDVGRLTFLSRLCYDAGYITEEQTWEYINQAYQLAIQNFDNWNSYSKSYIIGRGMWGGKDSANEGIMYIAEYLLKEEKSPWLQFSIK